MNAQQHSTTKLVLWSTFSVLSAIIAIGVLPPLFGGLSILFGYYARRQHQTVGTILMIMGSVALIAGFIIGALWGMENIRF